MSIVLIFIGFAAAVVGILRVRNRARATGLAVIIFGIVCAAIGVSIL